MEKTYYQLFGIKENADSISIKKAYHRLTLKYHPDKNNGSKEYEEIFKEINRIYSVLLHPLRRMQYDAELRKLRAEKYSESTTTTNSENPGNQNSEREENKASSKKWNFSIRYSPWRFILAFIILKIVIRAYAEHHPKPYVRQEKTDFGNAKSEVNRTP